MKILVTGAAGFIGYHLSKKLIREGHIVVGLDNINDYYDVNLKYARLNELGIQRSDAESWNVLSESDKFKENFTFVRMHLENRDELPTLFRNERFDVVCNLAAQAGVRYSLENPEAYIDSNVVGFLNILESCRHNSIKHLLYASSSSVYGESKEPVFSIADRVDHPMSLYAATKKSNELMAFTYSHLYGVQTTGLRFFTVYGPWGRPDMALFLFTDAIAKDNTIKVFNNGEMSRDFTYIDDIVAGIEILINKEPAKENTPPYWLANIGNGEPQSLMEFIEAIEKHMGKEAEKVFLPMQPGDVPRTSADTSELQKLGYKSTTGIDRGVEAFIDWYKAFYLSK
ncbi:UDP-glucuronate 4-epimerase [Pustulibacterium marinum]|uniref:UDP-glucuronate 4-epimerase n=1 Tax=Pustulibacterium marinum TaxID=1224947 RepID=A0A1I7F1T7_9FLAO|nr:NAD-dependent epimerase/dehydratase family protein [Pustulibacterium marinum]SFU30126.1 UDP-glucuronate 4-epimerase [Pustulibacterium marinum]